MSYSLFLDDERDPPNDTKLWIIARNFNAAQAIILVNGLPRFISFDHDLGAGPTGYDFVKWLSEYVMDNRLQFPEGFDFYVHSQNPVGKRNIENYLHAFLEHSNV